ncbi:MAG TPA: 2-phospho-L-lactate guanylyltransferase [Candidatus Methylomirabilis sp.]
MRVTLIPVKTFGRSKQRLAPLLSPDERTALAVAMFRDVLAAATAARGVDRVCVVTADAEALRLAAAAGAAALVEGEQRSESASVVWGAARCVAMGARSVLILPADLPLLAPADLEEVLAAAGEGPGVVLVPSADELGSNAILRTPPDAIPSRFGHGSFERHQREAAQRGLPCRVLRLPRVALDVDEVEHLEAVLAVEASTRPAGETSTHTHALLHRLGVAERLSARLPS